MDFQPIQPRQLNLEVQSGPIVQTNTIRMVQGQSLLDKPTFGQKFSLLFKKIGSFVGRLGGSVLRFLPFPGAQVASAALYGLGNLSERAHQKQQQRTLDDVALDEAGSRSNFNFNTPGIDLGNSVPASGGLERERIDTVLNREAAARENIAGL